MVFMAKTIMLLILGIDYLIGNSRAIIPLFSFSLGTIVFYSFFTEHFYSRVDNFRQIFNYSLSLVYFFSGLFVLIGYTLKDEERNGYFYFYILFCVIFLLISNYYVFRIKVINFRDNSQKLNELEIFLQVRKPQGNQQQPSALILPKVRNPLSSVQGNLYTPKRSLYCILPQDLILQNLHR